MLYTTLDVRTKLMDFGFAKAPVVEIGKNFILSDMRVCEERKYNIYLTGIRWVGHGKLFSGVSVGYSLNKIPVLQPVEDMNLYMLVSGGQAYELSTATREEFNPKVSYIKCSDGVNLLKVTPGALIEINAKRSEFSRYYRIYADKPHVEVYTREELELQYAEKGLPIPKFIRYWQY